MYQQAYDALHISIDNMQYEFFFGAKFSTQGKYSSSPHFHDFYELFYCVKGSIKIQGESEIVQLSAGDVGIIPAQTSHSVHTDEESVSILFSCWNGEKLWDTGHIHHLSNIPFGDTFSKMMDYYYGNYRYKKELLRACVSEIWILLMEYQQTLPPKSNAVITLENSLYRRYIIENYFVNYENANLNLSELATLLHLSIHQTQRIVTKLYGCNFRARLIFLRTEKAKSLLRSTDRSVGEIAASVGYKTVHGFSKVFKEVTGLTPSAFRKTSVKADRNNAEQNQCKNTP